MPLIREKDLSRRSRHALASDYSTTKQGSSVSPSGGDYNGDARLWGQTASDPTIGLSFVTGGASNVQGMSRLGASDPDNVTRTNQTERDGLNEVGDGSIAGGTIFLPIDLSVVLLLICAADV